MLARLSRAPVVSSIASIRGRATGVGSELALASDMRFASREKAVLSQWEVGAGLVPGGGPMARLPRLIGRGRALEVLLVADDINGELAELYGYVNRAFPDAELDGFVDALAMRVASFDKQAIAETKRLVDVASLPSDADIRPEWEAFLGALNRPASQKRIKALMERGFHRAWKKCSVQSFMIRAEQNENSTPVPMRLFSFKDPEENTRAQIAKVRSHPWIAKNIPVRGFIFDVDTGRLREVKHG